MKTWIRRAALAALAAAALGLAGCAASGRATQDGATAGIGTGFRFG